MVNFLRRNAERILFAFGIAVAIFAYGVAAAKYHIFPHSTLQAAFTAARDWQDNWQHYLGIRSNWVQDTKRAGGVTIHDRDRVWNGQTFINLYRDGSFKGVLIDMDGNDERHGVVHRQLHRVCRNGRRRRCRLRQLRIFAVSIIHRTTHAKGRQHLLPGRFVEDGVRIGELQRDRAVALIVDRRCRPDHSRCCRHPSKHWRGCPHEQMLNVLSLLLRSNALLVLGRRARHVRPRADPDRPPQRHDGVPVRDRDRQRHQRLADPRRALPRGAARRRRCRSKRSPPRSAGRCPARSPPPRPPPSRTRRWWSPTSAASGSSA